MIQSRHVPQIDATKDLFSQKDNDIITCGKPLRVSGSGVYCVPKDGSEPIKVKVEHIFIDTPSALKRINNTLSVFARSFLHGG